MRRLDGGLSATVLHISDTQFGRYHRFDDSDSLAGHLVRDVAGLVAAGVPPIDLVIMSGDIAERGKRPEFQQARAFADELCRALGLGPERVVTAPGNHDVSWDLCKATFAEWRDEHEDSDPPPPYPRKWRHYQDFVTGLHGPTAFTEDQPYRLHRFEDLRVVVAAMNSTIQESHEDHYGWCGRDQLRWFADQLAPAEDEGMLRIGVLHHNARRKAQADNENLRDEDDLTAILDGRLDLLLHGHTHEGKADRLSDGTLVLATGSAAVSAEWRPGDVPNQYQVLHIQPGSVTRWARQWDGHTRWIADPRASRRDEVRVRIRLEIPGWAERDGPDAVHEAVERLLGYAADQHPDFTAQVEMVTRLDLGETAKIERRVKEGDGRRLDYLLAFRPRTPLRCVGIVNGPADTAVVDEMDERVFSPLRSRGADSVELVVVHHGPDDPALRARARERAIHVKTWTEYNALLEAGPYRTWLRAALDTDQLYPQKLYQRQRFKDIDRFGHEGRDVREDLLGEVYRAVLAEDGQFLLILGEAGFGKSFLVRRLAHRLLENERASLTPIVIYLRDRDKRQSLDEMVSAAMLASQTAFRSDRFQHSLEAGTLALLIDGYDEFAVRVGYTNAATQLRTFTDAMSGRAKILLTTRPSHFRSTDEVTSKLFESIRSVHQGRVYQLEPFDEGQQRAFLTRWFELAGVAAPAGLAEEWMRALAAVDNLPELARTPRMLSFMVEDLSLDELQQAAARGTVTAAALYQQLVSRWLGEETARTAGAPGVVPAGQRQELLEELALHLWRAGERDVSEDALHDTARTVLDLPRLKLTLDQATQEFGGRTLLQVGDRQWRFAHQSVWEFLLARRLAAELKAGGGDELLGEAELTGLTIRFLRDLAPDEATAWAARVGGGGS